MSGGGHGLFGLHPSFQGGAGSEDDDSPPRVPPPNPSRVKRALFGPTDHEENLRFVRKELNNAAKIAQDRWNFDFEAECPLKGRFQWEPPKPEDVQEVYKLNRMPYLSSHTETLEKENRVTPSVTDPDKDLLSPASEGCNDLRTPQNPVGGGRSTTTPPSSPTPSTAPPHTAPPTDEREEESSQGATNTKKRDQRGKKMTDFLAARKPRPKSKGRRLPYDRKTETSTSTSANKRDESPSQSVSD